MKLLVFAHVPPPHHGQAVMVELMLKGLGEEKLKEEEGNENQLMRRRGGGAEGRDERPARPGDGREEPLSNSIASRNGGGGFEENKAGCRAAKDFAGRHRESSSLTSDLAEHDFTQCTPAAGSPRQRDLPPSSERADDRAGHPLE